MNAPRHTASAHRAAGAPVVGSLCTGYGGLDLGLAAAVGGVELAWVADPDPHIARLLTARYPGVPNLGDITLDWAAVPPVDVITAGFPRKDISIAGRGAGITGGTRNGVWTHVMAAVRVLRPALLLLENVAALRYPRRGLGSVLGDLAEAGYDTVWDSVRAADIGAPHRRDRCFIPAWPARPDGGGAADPAGRRRRTRRNRPGHQDGGPAPGEPHRRRHPPDHPARGLSQAARGGDVADPVRGQPQRRGGPAIVAGTPGPATPAPDQWQRNGYAVVGRGGAVGDPDRLRRQGLRAPQHGHGAVADPPDPAAADPAGQRRHQGQPPPTPIPRRPDAALRRDPHHHPDTPTLSWGRYTDAIQRWEHLLSRPAPPPTEPGRTGRPASAPRSSNR